MLQDATEGNFSQIYILVRNKSNIADISDSMEESLKKLMKKAGVLEQVVSSYKKFHKIKSMSVI